MVKKMASKSEGNDRQNSGRPNDSLHLKILERALDYIDDIGIILLLMLAVLGLLGLLQFTHGGVIDPIVNGLNRWFGLGAFLFPLILVLIATYLLRRRLGDRVAIPWTRVISVEIMLFALLGILSAIDGMDLPRAETGMGGGIIGWGISTLLAEVLGRVGSMILLLIVFIAAGVFGIRAILLSALATRETRSRPQQTHDGAVAVGASVVERSEKDASVTPRKTHRLPREYRKDFQVVDQKDDKPSRPMRRDSTLPPMELLEDSPSKRVTSKEINHAAGLIEKTLADFGLPARVVDFRTGPAVTQFAVEPGYVEHVGSDGETKRQKVRVSQISALSSDLALALSAPRLRIEAPVPGQAYVGIEVPNQKATLVRLKPLLQTETFHKISSPLAIALGRNVAGAAVVADLTSMPHLLIAGTTGSGKSVCITSIATCLSFNNTPEDLRIVMIDPKMVELIRFNGLPHLYGRVETELERIIGVLRWCTVEMDRRYRLLEEAKARDIDMYNQKKKRRKDAEQLPRVVILIDELADLMMMAPDQTEHTLVRLAQMARAVGIHLVVATQRPSTDILTGLIKANFPARILRQARFRRGSFAVASGIDSRVILDGPGAETLLGKGDMLYLSPEAGAPVRLQGAFVSDKEVEGLIQYWQKEIEDEDVETRVPPWEDLLQRQVVLGDRDDILEQAIELVKQRGEASASMLQRGLRIGYPRAARLMDELEELGVVGRAQSGGRTREVLISDDDDPLEKAAEEEDDESS